MPDKGPVNTHNASLHAAQAVEECLNYLTSALLAKATQDASGLAPTLEMPGLIIMLFISSRGPTSPAAIVKETGIDKTVVTHSLETLRIHGHVTPISNEYNRGQSLYSATRRGMKHLEQTRAQNIHEYAQVLATWTESEINRFVEALKTFAGGIGSSR